MMFIRSKALITHNLLDRHRQHMTKRNMRFLNMHDLVTWHGKQHIAKRYQLTTTLASKADGIDA